MKIRTGRKMAAADGTPQGLECTHQWKTCPIHSNPDSSLPPFRIVLTCLYGGLPTKAGTSWDQDDSDEVVERITARDPSR